MTTGNKLFILGAALLLLLTWHMTGVKEREAVLIRQCIGQGVPEFMCVGMVKP